MEHTLEIKTVEKTSKEGNKYLDCYAVVDGFMIVRFDSSRDNFWNLMNIIRNGDNITVVGREIQYKKN